MKKKILDFISKYHWFDKYFNLKFVKLDQNKLNTKWNKIFNF